MTTFTTLRADIKEWMLNDNVNETRFITLAEAEFNRSLRVLPMQTATQITVNSQRTTLPAGFLQAGRVTLDEINGLIDYMTPERLFESNVYFKEGRPQAYTIESDVSGVPELVMAPAPVTDTTVNISYYTKFTALSDANQSNWLSTNHYDAYLYGSLLHAGPYLKDVEMMSFFIEGYTRAMESIRAEDTRKKYAGTSLKRIPARNP